MKIQGKQLQVGGALITLVGAILFSTKAIFVKLAFQETHIDPLSLLTLRMLFSLPFYLGIAVWVRKKQTEAISRKQLLYIAGMGIMGYYLSSLFDFMGLAYISAGLERLILFLYPTFAVLINLFLFRQKISSVQQRALLLTYAGIMLAFFTELKLTQGNPAVVWGSFLVFLCAVTYSIYIVGTGRLVQKVNATLFTAYAMLAATAGILAHYLFRGNFTALHFNARLWGYGGLLAVIATVIPSFLLSEGMKRIGSNNVAIMLAIGPVSTILQAWLFLNEKITWLQIAGTLLVIAGILMIGWKSKTYES